MDQWLLGAIQSLVVTAPQFKISSETCGIFRPHTLHLLWFWTNGSVKALGQRSHWWWLLRSSRSAQQCAPNSGKWLRICGNLSWWISGCLGQFNLWWWLLRSSRSAHERPANSGHRRCICSDFGRWISGCLGRSRWWWLLRSSRSAQKRAAYSGNRRCICSDLAWWVTSCLGSVRERRQLFRQFRICSCICRSLLILFHILIGEQMTVGNSPHFASQGMRVAVTISVRESSHSRESNIHPKNSNKLCNH